MTHAILFCILQLFNQALIDQESNIVLLDMISQTSNAKWIWLRLGLLHTEKGEVEKAITYLCNAVRSDPSDW